MSTHFTSPSSMSSLSGDILTMCPFIWTNVKAPYIYWKALLSTELLQSIHIGKLFGSTIYLPLLMHCFSFVPTQSLNQYTIR